MFLKRTMLLIVLLFVICGCQPKEQSEQKSTLQVSEMNQNKQQTIKTAEIDENDEQEYEVEIKETQEQVVTLGIEGYTEEVTVRRFENDWLSMWVDVELTKQEQGEEILFNQEGNNLEFSVRRLPSDSASEHVDTYINKLLHTGYELIEQFPLDNRQGNGSILYSYSERQSVDIYLLEEKKEHLVVRFVIPDSLMDKYTHRFEYMLHSIELLS